MSRLPLVLLAGVCTVSLAHAQQLESPAAAPAEVAATSGTAGTTVAATSATEAAPPAAPASPAASAAAPASPAAPRVAPVVRSTSAVDMTKEYLIGPEDVLDITVWKNCPDLCRTVPVRPDGKLSLPLVNDVQASGRTPMDLR